MTECIEYFENDFDSSISEKIKVQNAPYVAYSSSEDEVIYTIAPNYLYFEALSEPVYIGFNKSGATVEYSLDKVIWTAFTSASTVEIQSGKRLYIRGLNPNGFSTGSGGFTSSGGTFNLGGNIMTLIDYENPPSTSMVGSFMCLFENSNVVDASKLLLPCTYLTEGCYWWMFKGCKYLTEVPVLPATNLAKSCYAYMFSLCSQLKVAPELPALTLHDSCYSCMFQGCSSLIVPPQLPASILMPYCYEGMFMGCVSLVRTPNLYADIMADWCYRRMFYGCTSLTEVSQLPVITLAEGCFASMFHGCTSLVVAPELPNVELAPLCYAGMFRECSNLTTAPALPATELATQCYESMFHDCTSLTTAPDLLAPTLVDECYYCMFTGCSNLNYIKCLATDISSADYTTGAWVDGVASTGTFIYDLETAWSVGSDGIPTGWRTQELDKLLIFTARQNNSSIGLVQIGSNHKIWYSKDRITWNVLNTNTTIPLSKNESVALAGKYFPGEDYTQFTMSGKIEASNSCNAIWDYLDLNAPLKDNCGYYMFQGCSSLTKAPDLPSTEIASYCYMGMFQSCSSLTAAPELPATELAYRCYSFMFRGCTSLINAPTLPAPILYDYCYYQMFRGCSSLSSIECLAEQIDGTYTTDHWVESVAEEGTFTGNLDIWSVGGSGVPTGWVPIQKGTGLVILKTLTANNIVKLQKLSSNQQLWYSTDGFEYLPFTTSTTINLTQIGDKVYLRGILNGVNNTSNYTQITSKNTLVGSGCCNAIWNYLDLSAELKPYCGYKLFQGCLLTEAPTLPSLTLNTGCYSYMFASNVRLQKAPELPAKTLVGSCYRSMFSGCTSLTKSPDLPATSVPALAYAYMFQNCSSLSYISCSATSFSSSFSTTSWTNGVSSSGHFRLSLNNPEEVWSFGTSGIPEGWTYGIWEPLSPLVN